jgi:hypothetical protein
MIRSGRRASAIHVQASVSVEHGLAQRAVGHPEILAKLTRRIQKADALIPGVGDSKLSRWGDGNPLWTAEFANPLSLFSENPEKSALAVQHPNRGTRTVEHRDQGISNDQVYGNQERRIAILLLSTSDGARKGQHAQARRRPGI